MKNILKDTYTIKLLLQSFLCYFLNLHFLLYCLAKIIYFYSIFENHPYYKFL